MYIKKFNSSSVIYGKKILIMQYVILLSCITSWFLFYIKLLQTALKLLLFEKLLPPQCDRACIVPVEALLSKKSV